MSVCVLIYLLESVLFFRYPDDDGYCTARARGIHLLTVVDSPSFFVALPISSYLRSFSKTTVATGDDDANAGSAADKGNADATGLTPSDDAVD